MFLNFKGVGERERKEKNMVVGAILIPRTCLAHTCLHRIEALRYFKCYSKKVVLSGWMTLHALPE